MPETSKDSGDHRHDQSGLICGSRARFVGIDPAAHERIGEPERRRTSHRRMLISMGLWQPCGSESICARTDRALSSSLTYDSLSPAFDAPIKSNEIQVEYRHIS